MHLLGFYFDVQQQPEEQQSEGCSIQFKYRHAILSAQEKAARDATRLSAGPQPDSLLRSYLQWVAGDDVDSEEWQMEWAASNMT